MHKAACGFWRSALFAICVSSIQGSYAQPSHKAAQYKTFNSQAMTFGSDPKFFWIDNQELIFVSIEKFPDTSSKSAERLTYSVSRWNIQARTVRLVRDFGENRPLLCFYDGSLLYGAMHKRDAPAYYAKLGEVEREVNIQEYDYLFCQSRKNTPKLPVWTEGHEIRLLHKLGAGFLDFGDTKKGLENTPIRLYRYNAQQGEGLELPLKRRDTGKRFPYYEFKRAFFVVSDYYLHPRPKEIPYPVYWLYEDGRVEKIADIPWGPWRSSASFSPFPTRAGLIMASHNFNVRNANDIADAGLYLFVHGRVERIVKGWVDSLAVAVSPDGCKIAFTYAPVVTRRNNVLQAMDLCGGGVK
jgi:hypothetical protein